VSISHPSKASKEGKRQKSTFARISSGAADLRSSFVSPTTDEKARRIAELRAVLAYTAPHFQAHGRHAGEGRS
jgi:hypothetical protein